MISALGFNSNNIYRQQKNEIIDQHYKEIYAHEKAHKNAAGSLGGSIVIEKDTNGIPVGGHVDIKMPVLDKDNPERTIQHADTVIKAAMAPNSPSSQDYKVASEAEAIKNKAKNIKNQSGQRLNLLA